MTKLNKGTTNDNGEILISSSAKNKLLNRHKYFFGNTRNANFLIDYIVTNKEICPKQSFKFKFKSSTRKRSQYMETFNIELIMEEFIKTLYHNRLKGINQGRIHYNAILEQAERNKLWIKK